MLWSAVFRPSHAIIASIAATAGIYAGLFALNGIFIPIAPPGSTLLSMAENLHPVLAMHATTEAMMDPSGGAWLTYLWVPQCGVILAATGVILWVCSVALRRVAARRAFGTSAPAAPATAAVAPVPVAELADAAPRHPVGVAAKIRRVSRWPVVWRELADPLVRGKTGTFVLLVVAITLTMVSYTHGFLDAYSSAAAHAYYTVAFASFGMVCTTVHSSVSIAREREARTLPALLATPLSARQILLGKGIGVAYQGMFPWLFLIGHVALFTMAGVLHPAAALHVSMLIVWPHVFLIGVGLYFSTRFRRSGSAIIASFSLIAGLWIVVPLGARAVRSLIPPSASTARAVCKVIGAAAVCGNPVVQIWVATIAAWREQDYLHLWPGGQSFGGATRTIFGSMLIYSGIGLLFAWRAGRRLRRDVF